MTWENVYFACFLIGLLMSLLSLLGGSHLHFHHGVQIHIGHGVGKGSQNSPINFSTVAAFLAWFGAAGYLITRFTTLWTLLALALSFITGLGGAAVVFLFLVKFMLTHDYELDPADYEMTGVLGHVSSPVREGGTGEMIYSQAGARRAASIRSDTGAAIPKGTEVVVIRYENGIAYVRPWDELSRMDTATAGER